MFVEMVSIYDYYTVNMQTKSSLLLLRPNINLTFTMKDFFLPCYVIQNWSSQRYGQLPFWLSISEVSDEQPFDKPQV